MMFSGSRKASKMVQQCLLGFSARLATLEREQRSLKLEWLETYDKINRLMARLAKRDAIDNPKPKPSDNPGLDMFTRSDTISAEILARRRKGMNS